MINNTKIFPLTINKLPKLLNKQATKNYKDIDYFVQVGPEKWLLLDLYQNHYHSYRNFQIYPDDIFIMGYPRSGTLMTESIVWLLENNLDFHQFYNTKQDEKVIFLDQATFSSNRTDILDGHHHSKRIFKTHLPFELLPPNILEIGCKIIYIARNPKDVIPSQFVLHKQSNTHPFLGDFQTFFELFEQDLIIFNPYWSHIRQAWSKRYHPNYHFMFYEDYHNNRFGKISELSTFLNCRYTNNQIDNLIKFMEFDNFKRIQAKNCNRNDYVNRGKVGCWKDLISDELDKKINQWISDGVKKVGDNFPISFYRN